MRKDMKAMIIRLEQPQDYREVENLTREAFTLLLLVVVHNEETQAEEHGEDTIHLA